MHALYVRCASMHALYVRYARMHALYVRYASMHALYVRYASMHALYVRCARMHALYVRYASMHACIKTTKRNSGDQIPSPPSTLPGPFLWLWICIKKARTGSCLGLDGQVTVTVTGHGHGHGVFIIFRSRRVRGTERLRVWRLCIFVCVSPVMRHQGRKYICVQIATRCVLCVSRMLSHDADAGS